MPDLKRIQVTLPEPLLMEVDRVLMVERMNRSQLIREAVNLYMTELKRKALRDQMRRGYVEMARINLELAMEGFIAEFDAELVNEARLVR
ncbi:CopG family ribbon-helix-helix protein [Heliophilum fasciatum]|uniref:CopG family transcriptional regulator/antitoxin EndoAI n=1 Tax=Heliophilum fasciatum TaxID=35700 RepID=A0A4R2RWS5_9FIRM|nr:ribbon-helix-helix protein, CopG family [Heliophilum fasciatum]MCW2276697.1 CopG family transcriptional regulator/antitoxin EndoAI [Heliophilum fasciatum]TCP68922.1 CopG family transcriptional regulator/antitoxin EndoAI [Heliophilum fasciatum]